MLCFMKLVIFHAISCEINEAIFRKISVENSSCFESEYNYVTFQGRGVAKI